MANKITRKSGQDLLSWVAERCQHNLLSHGEAIDYLRRNGATDERAWSAFRVGIGDAEFLDGLSGEDLAALGLLGLLPVKRGRSVLCHGGVILPTYNPENPLKPVGFIKQNYGQNKHAFATPPNGLACTADVNEHKKIIVADAPLLALRLAGAGAKGVVVAEGVQVVENLKDWFTGREVVFASYREQWKTAFLSAVPNAEAVKAHTSVMDSSETVLNLLGVNQRKAEITPALLRKVLDYARARIAEGQGRELLSKLGADNGEFVTAYHIGYLPSDFLNALDPESKRALKDNLAGDCLVVPAFDERMQPVDLLRVNRDRVETRLFEPARGLVGANVASVFDGVAVAHSIESAARSFKSGMRNVIVLRGVEDAKRNVERLAAVGIHSAKIDIGPECKAIAAALTGIECCITDISSVKAQTAEAAAVPVIPGDTPVLVKHDTKTESAVFAVDDARYEVEVTVDGGSRLSVRLERQGKLALDRFDLASEAQRRRFATSAAMKTLLPFEMVEAHLICILDSVKALQESLLNPVRRQAVQPEVSETEKKEALAYLGRADLLDAVAADLESMGWTGEERNKRLLYLAAISRKLHSPLSAALISSSGAGKSVGIETISTLTPAEDLIHVSRLSDSALFYFDKDALRHKLLVVDESDALSREAIVSLRVLQSRGALSQSRVLRDPATGGTVTQFVEARGPVAVLTSTAGKLDRELLSRCFDLPVDESPAQTARVLEAQRRARSNPEGSGADGLKSKIARRHQNMQRLLASLPVVTAFADRIEFPATSIKYRREQERFLNLIEASALLHQHQRLKQKNATGEEFIIADMRDFEIARGLCAESVARAADDLSGHGRELLALIENAKLESVSMEGLKALRPEWTRYRFRTGLDELVRLEVLTSLRSGRGKAREYRLQAKSNVTPLRAEVRIREVGELAKVGEAEIANFNLRAAIG